MPVLNIQPGKPNRGATYMGMCPKCGIRKRLNFYAGAWQFWCSTKCGHREIIGTNAELAALLNR